MENTSQFMELSESEMLDLWKTMMQLQPAHYGCAIERTDGIDIDELLLIHIRKWYASLLLSAPDGIVPVEDVKDRLNRRVEDVFAIGGAHHAACHIKDWKFAVGEHFPVKLEPGSSTT